MQTGKRTFKHLSRNDRLRIEKWQRMGMKPREIAEKLRVHVSTIYRELKRGEYERLDGATWEMVTAYSPDIAEARYQEHLREKGPDLKIGKDHELANYIETTITEWECSPAAVLGYAMLEGRTFETSVSVTTIYSYIKKGLFLHITQVDLPRRGKVKQKCKKIKTRKIRHGPLWVRALSSARRRWKAARSSGIGRATPCTAERASARPPAPC